MLNEAITQFSLVFAEFSIGLLLLHKCCRMVCSEWSMWLLSSICACSISDKKRESFAAL